MTEQHEHNRPGHISVLLQETIDSLDIQPGDTVIDGTLGSGGHSEEILKRFGSQITLIGLDMDEDAIKRTEKRLAPFQGNTTFIQDNFRNIKPVLESLNKSNVNKILLDIGLSSNQLDTSGRGFSFTKEEPLEMTFKKNPTEEDVTAYTIVNEWSEETIADIIYAYGEERYARRIAAEIIRTREESPIKTTTDLVDIVAAATPSKYHHGRIHPATRTFQALRIAVNDELQALKQGLEDGFSALSQNGRIAVISFHSLEDRIIKRFFKEKDTERTGELLFKKPLVPSEAEISQNPRSRSAKLRVIKKI